MLLEYGDPRITVTNRRRDGTIITPEEMKGMVIPINDDTIVAYQIIWEVACQKAAREAEKKKAAGE